MKLFEKQISIRLTEDESGFVCQVGYGGLLLKTTEFPLWTNLSNATGRVRTPDHRDGPQHSTDTNF